MDAARKARMVAKIWVTKQGNKVLSKLDENASNVDFQVDLEDFHNRVKNLDVCQSEAIWGLLLTGASYKTACDILIKRFGRKEKIIFSHVQALLGVQVPDRPSVEALWILYSDLQSNIRSLDSLAITGRQFGVILTPLILSQLPASLRLELA